MNKIHKQFIPTQNTHTYIVMGCSQGLLKEGFVMGPRTRGVQENIEYSPPHKAGHHWGWDPWSRATESYFAHQ